MLIYELNKSSLTYLLGSVNGSFCVWLLVRRPLFFYSSLSHACSLYLSLSPPLSLSRSLPLSSPFSNPFFLCHFHTFFLSATLTVPPFVSLYLSYRYSPPPSPLFNALLHMPLISSINGHKTQHTTYKHTIHLLREASAANELWIQLIDRDKWVLLIWRHFLLFIIWICLFLWLFIDCLHFRRRRALKHIRNSGLNQNIMHQKRNIKEKNISIVISL